MQHIQIAGTPLEPLLPLYLEREKRNTINYRTQWQKDKGLGNPQPSS